MDPEHANLIGNVHGGWIMKLVDEAGGAGLYAPLPTAVVTVAINSMVFRNPIKIGDLVLLNAEVTFTGRTSMEAEVQVQAENPISGERTHTNTAYLVYVALDDNGKPTPVLLSKQRPKMKSAAWKPPVNVSPAVWQTNNLMSLRGGVLPPSGVLSMAISSNYPTCETC